MAADVTIKFRITEQASPCGWLEAVNEDWYGKQEDGEPNEQCMNHGVLPPVRVSTAQKSLPAAVHDRPCDHQCVTSNPVSLKFAMMRLLEFILPYDRLLWYLSRYEIVPFACEVLELI